MKKYFPLLFILVLLLIFHLPACKKNQSVEEVNLKPAKSFRYITAKSGLRLRANHNLKSTRIGLIPFGTKVEMLEEHGKEITIGKAAGKWSKVIWKDRTGWVFGGFLSDNNIEIQD